MFPTITDIRNAHERIKSYIHRTPVLTCQTINDICGAELFFKCENFQKGGAFKIRGATNAVQLLTKQQAKQGVATHSSGNHGAALALAAKSRNIPAYVVMPENSPSIKKEAVQSYGGKVIFCKPTLESRETTLAKIVEETRAAFIPPYNDYRIMAGQGTATLELLEDAPALDVLVVPVGGGGLISGAALTAATISSKTRVVGAEPQIADDAFRSLKQGILLPSDNSATIADGLRGALGHLTFPIIQQHVTEIITVSEASIVQAMRLIWERMKIIVEPSAAVPLAACLTRKEKFQKQSIGILLSGGNVDLANLPW